MSRVLLLTVCGFFLLTSCKRADKTAENTSQPPTTEGGGTAAVFDACSLITRQEIETVEKSPVTDTKNSGRSEAGISFAQCFFTTAEFNRSVSLAVTQGAGTGSAKRSVKEYWQGMFDKFKDDGKDREKEKAQEEADKEKRESLREQKREREEEGEGVPPKKVTGVGDEAYWLGNRVGGALYVLKKDKFIRISVGGPDPEEGKIEKCKALAEKALTRL